MATTSPSPSFFDQWSATYDQAGLQALTYRPIHDAILKRLGSVEPEVVVDLGCGTGQLTQRLIDRFPGALIAGVDLSPGMLSAAAARIEPTATSGTGLVQADAQHLPIRPESVDIVVCTESFHWYEDQMAALEGLADVIRPGGRLLIASIATTSSVGDDALRRLSALRRQPIRALPPHRLRLLLRRCGYDVIHQRRIPRLGLIPWPVLTDSVRR